MSYRRVPVKMYKNSKNEIWTQIQLGIDNFKTKTKSLDLHNFTRILWTQLNLIVRTINLCTLIVLSDDPLKRKSWWTHKHQTGPPCPTNVPLHLNICCGSYTEIIHKNKVCTTKPDYRSYCTEYRSYQDINININTEYRLQTRILLI